MATTRNATTHWEGSLTEGAGQVTLQHASGIGTYDVSWAARSEEASGKTSPEELIAAAHSSCFSMALSHGLTGAGTPPTSIDTKAEVQFQAGQGIIGIHLTVRANVPGLSDGYSEKAAAEGAKANCPVSKVLAAVENITLDAALADSSPAASARRPRVLGLRVGRSPALGAPRGARPSLGERDLDALVVEPGLVAAAARGDRPLLHEQPSSQRRSATRPLPSSSTPQT